MPVNPHPNFRARSQVSISLARYDQNFDQNFWKKKVGQLQTSKTSTKNAYVFKSCSYGEVGSCFQLPTSFTGSVFSKNLVTAFFAQIKHDFARTSKCLASWVFEKKKLVTFFLQKKHPINESQSSIFFHQFWSLCSNYNFIVL